MVVTRRSSAGPMPPTSRTSSSTATPRLNKGKAPQTSSLAQEIEASFANADGLDGSLKSPDHSGPQFSDNAQFSDGSPTKSPPKLKGKGRTKKKDETKQKLPRKKRPASLLDILSRAFLICFLIYSCSVCPFDKTLSSPVCRGISEYRRLILEPVIIQPIQRAIQHPSVAPYVNPVIDAAKPAVARAQDEWVKHVIPQWQQHVSPHIDTLYAKTEPYRTKASAAYDKNLSPYVVQIGRYSRKAQPYILLTAAKTYDFYQASKPYLASTYVQLQRIPPFLGTHVLAPLADGRRQFVDPHVALLVEKVKELSSGSGTGKPAAEVKVGHDQDAGDLTVPAATAEEETLASAASVVSASAYLSAGSDAMRFASVPGATYSPAPEHQPEQSELIHEVFESVPPEAVPEEVSEGVPTETESQEHTVVYVTETAIEISVETVVVSETAVVTETGTEVEYVSVPHTPDFMGKAKETPVTVIEAVTETALSLASEASEVAEDVVSSASSVVAPLASSISSAAVSETAVKVKPDPPAPSPIDPEDEDFDINLDEFVAELELEEDEAPEPESEVIEPPPAPPVVEETEEEKAERKRKEVERNAEKRRKIEARTAEWERKLKDIVKEQKKALRKGLLAVRKAAAADLKSNSKLRGEIEKLNKEGDKALRGTESYFKKLRASDKPREERVRLWDRVLEKVEVKFQERLDGVRTLVHEWVMENVANKEREELDKATKAVKDLAESAQADIGLDWAWIEDVTVKDWKRYHALKGTYNEFVDLAMSIQNGTHPSPPKNPSHDALKEVQVELADIELGFNTRMRQITREGEQAFRADEPLSSGEDERDDDHKGAQEPEVSILPIAGDGTTKGKSEESVLQEVSDAILGRTEGEVAGALERAEEQEKVSHNEL